MNKDESSKDKLTLKKNLKPINVWSLALGSIIGWGAFVMPGNLFLKTAGPLGTAIGIIIGAFIMITISLSYGFMIRRFPVSGGEFAFAFKGFGRRHAFICAWFLSLSYLSIVPLNATALGLIGRYMFPGILQRGYIYTVAGWDVYLGEVVFASFALVVFGFISIKGIKTSGIIQTLMVFALVGSTFILAISAFINKKVSIINLQPLFAPEASPIIGILRIVAIAPWAFVGFDTIPQVAEEFNFPSKKANILMIISIVFGAMIYIIINTVTAIAFPWYEFISSNPSWATGTAVKQLMGNIGLFILGIGLLTAVLTGIMGFYVASSRLLLAMARAQALPRWFGFIHPKYRTPSNAIKFVMFLSLVAPWFGREVLLWIVDMSSIGAAFGYFYTSASTFKLLMGEKGHIGLKIFSFIGSILSLGFVILLIVPGMPAYLSLPSRILLMLWIALGIVFYVTSIPSYCRLTSEELEKLILVEK